MEHGRHIFEIDLTPVRYRHSCHLSDVLLVVLGADICYVYNWLKHSKHIGSSIAMPKGDTGAAKLPCTP